ncbi:GNAT family N-acetyltransferase [Haloarchaeobius baliensis]|uniref:GNAT family N-acetyltransferase n=1 Tax=Haloarchaeobius baliensis TaxID=1670458 RepID=UPI003F883157
MSDLELALLGWPEDRPTLRLDYRRFSYAGKFVMSSTGKAVAHDPTAETGDDDEFDDHVVAAVAFNEDRTDPDTLWLRYVTVREDHRGEGLGPGLVRFTNGRARERGYDRVRIAVNNPYSYEALYRAGFGFTGEETGIAELVLERPGDRSPARYRDGLDVFAAREDLSDDERSFVAEKRERGPPSMPGGGESAGGRPPDGADRDRQD